MKTKPANNVLKIATFAKMQTSARDAFMGSIFKMESVTYVGLPVLSVNPFKIVAIVKVPIILQKGNVLHVAKTVHFVTPLITVPNVFRLLTQA